MKKFLATALALILALSLTIVAFAADTDEDAAPQTTVSLKVDPTYTVTIPGKVVLEEQTDGTYAQNATIICSSARLAENKEITVTMASNFTLRDATTGATLAYTVTVGTTAIATGGTVATFGTSTTEQSSVLYFAAGVPTYAGDYADTAVFTIAVTDK